MPRSPILETFPLGAPWRTFDPFLFCMHHLDDYPPGNEDMGPRASLGGRRIGQDFSGREGWSMYHGEVVPGFPQHPHRGFETITLVRQGHIDHADSLGATARLGAGDVQWMTAGQGVVHAETFPLVERQRRNPTELFQIWINLPAKDKLVTPYFTMMWGEQVPTHHLQDADGRGVHVTTVAGALDGVAAVTPPPDSWAARAHAHVAFWSIRMEAGARWTLPAGDEGLNRALYAFAGALTLADEPMTQGSGVRVRSDVELELIAGERGAELVMLQGRPLNEPVAHYGPFVMNTRAELEAAFAEYRRTGFGAWPWSSKDPVHHRDAGRFAIHADGREERPPTADEADQAR